MKVDVQYNHYDLRVTINGLVHVYIRRKEFVGFQSWKDDERMYVIEYYTTRNKIRTEFDSRQKWLQVLKKLNEKL